MFKNDKVLTKPFVGNGFPEITFAYLLPNFKSHMYMKSHRTKLRKRINAKQSLNALRN